MDELKKHIQQRLDELDIDEPSEQNWENIQQQLFPKKRLVISLTVRWLAAACVLLLAGIGFFLIDKNDNPKPIVLVPLVTKEIKSSTVQPASAITNAKEDGGVGVRGMKLISQKETKTATTDSRKEFAIEKKHKEIKRNYTAEKALLGMESSFTQVINLERERINTTPLNAEDPGYYKDFGQRMKEMETDEAIIKHDIRKQGITDDLLDRLINIYQQKLNVLKQLQTEILKTNTRYKQSRQQGQVDNQKTYFLNI